MADGQFGKFVFVVPKCHANCLKTIDLFFSHCSSCCSTPKIFGVTYMFPSVDPWPWRGPFTLALHASNDFCQFDLIGP